MTQPHGVPTNGPMKTQYQLAGRYKLVATNSKGEQRVVADWFDNLILNAGLNRMGTGSVINRAFVGTGNSTPAAGQTLLDAQVGETTNRTAQVDGFDSVGNAYVWRRVTYRFAAGTATGNLAEVGVGWTTGGLFSRALIKDGFGSPTTITILSDETLDVIYELRVYVPADIVGTFTMSGVTYDVTVRAKRINGNTAGAFSDWYLGTMFDNGMTDPNYSISGGYAYGAGALGDVLSDPAGANIGSGTSAPFGPYVNNSYERTYRTTYGLSSPTVAISALAFFSRLGAWKVSFSPTIAKDNTKVLTIDWKVGWARRP